MDEIYDIAIIGGGIVGASTAYALARKRSVVLLEMEDAMGFHSTGRSAAEFSRRFHSDIVGKLTTASAGFMFATPTGFSDVDLLRPRGNLVIADVEKKERLRQVFEYECANTPKGANPIESLSVVQAIEKIPFLDERWLAAAFYDPDCWDVEVATLLQGYIKSAKNNGTKVMLGAGVNAARREGNYWVIETAKGTIRAKMVVNAAGAWADSVAEIFGLGALELIPHRRTIITVKVPDYDVTHMPGVNEIDEVFYFKPDAGHLMISPADETPVAPHDAWPEELDIAFAAHYLGECTALDVQHVAHSWAGLRTLSKDRLPVIGCSSRTEGFFWLAGLGGYGIQTSPAVGQIAAALLTAAPMPDAVIQTGLTSSLFSPARFGG